jgi:hypothetical protein
MSLDQEITEYANKAGFDVLSKYSHSFVQMDFRCHKCTGIIKARWSDFRRGIKNKCRLCESNKTTKTCSVCKIEKSLDCFSPKGKYRTNKCKSCNALLVKTQNHQSGKSKTYKGDPRKDLTGKRCGMLTVQSQSRMTSSGRVWTCKCDCGNVKEARHNLLAQNKVHSCGCSHKRSGACNPLWQGHGEISQQKWLCITRQRKSDRTIDITIEEAWDLFLEQNRKCALTGIELSFGRNNNEKATASLDRIDSQGHYTIENVQWVHKDINWMKNRFSQQYFIEMCCRVADHSRQPTA